MRLTFPEACPIRRPGEQLRVNMIDEGLRDLARNYGALEVDYPVLISRRALERAEYPKAFPHLLLAAACLHDPELAPDALLKPGTLICSSWCLSPAVCYHAYVQLAGREILSPQVITARGRCFRNESEVEPGTRQVEFEMREIVLMGKKEWVNETAGAVQRDLAELARGFGLDGAWQPAEDPFFLPQAKGKALMQRLLELKLEFCTPGPNPVALASVNRHGTFFAERFEIADRSGEPVETTCIAAGLDRWAARACLASAKEVNSCPP